MAAFRNPGFSTISAIAYSVRTQGKIKICFNDDRTEPNESTLVLVHFWKIHARVFWRMTARLCDEHGCQRILDFRQFRPVRTRFARKAKSKVSKDDLLKQNTKSLCLLHFWKTHARVCWHVTSRGGEKQGFQGNPGFPAISSLIASSIRTQTEIKSCSKDGPI
jgi:hypothetical protein